MKLLQNVIKKHRQIFQKSKFKLRKIFKVKPIKQAFKAAKVICRIANEWRDSICYLGVGVGSLHFALQEPDLKKAAIALAGLSIMGCVAREGSRAFSWLLSSCNEEKYRQFAGIHSQQPVDTKKNALAAATVTISGLSLFAPIFCMSSSNLGLTVGVPTAALGSLVAYKRMYGDLKQIIDQYFNRTSGIWNWPKTKGDGGGGNTTQTQEALDWIESKAQVLSGLAPQPERIPVRVPVSRYATNLNA